MRGVPLHSVGIVVQVLNYALFNWVYKYFVVNDGRKHFLLCLQQDAQVSQFFLPQYRNAPHGLVRGADKARDFCFKKTDGIVQDSPQNFAVSMLLGIEEVQRRQLPISSTEVA